MMRRWLSMLACAAALMSMTSAACGFADSVTFTGSPIALKGITIQSLQNGKLTYIDSSGQRQSRSLDDVQALGFDQFAELDAAEQALAKGDLDAGLKSLLRAMLASDSDLEKLWVHARLARVHDLRKEYAPAAGHAAAVMLVSADAYWRALEPVCPPSQAEFAAVKEAFDNLQAAKAKVKVTDLSNSIARMLKVVQPQHDALAAEYQGAPITAGSTISGIARGEILGDGLEAPINKPTSPAATTVAARPAVAAPSKSSSPPPASKPAAPVKPDELKPTENNPRAAALLDALLAAGRNDQALELCRQIEKEPGDRDLGHFLYQYGSALKGSGQAREAAVMFMRGALLFPDGSDAPASLIECAEIHQAVIQNPETARRLLERAADLAESLDQPTMVSKARQALQLLPPSSSPKEP